MAIALNSQPHIGINAGTKALRVASMISSLLSGRSLLGLQAQPHVVFRFALSLRWPSPLGGRWRRRGFVIAPPLVNGPAHAEPRATNGDQYYGGDEPVFHSNVPFAPHYSHERSNAYA